MAQASRDQNSVPTLLAVSSVDGVTPVLVYADPVTHRLLTDTAAGTGTVTTVSVVSANGFAGTVANATTTPAITLTTTVTGILSGNGTAISAASTTGTGAVVLANTPTLITPVLGVATATSLNGLTVTSTTGTLTIAAAKVLTQNATLTYTGTDGSSVNFGTGGTVLYSASTIPLTVGTTTIASGTTTRILYDNAGVLGEYTLTGTGTVAVMQTSPSLITPALGVATATSLNGLTISTTTGTLTMTNGKTLTVSDSTTLATSAITLGNGKVLTLSNTLTLAGTDSTVMTFPTTSATIARTDAANTFSGIQTVTNVTLPDQGQIKLTVPTTDLKCTGFTCGDFNSGYSSSAIGDLVYLDSSATWQKTDANTLALYNGLLGIALEVKASGNALLVALPGSMIYSTTGFPTWTIGSPIYMSETAGAMTHTAPTTTDAATRVVGWGIHADKMYFFPSPDYVTHT